MGARQGTSNGPPACPFGTSEHLCVVSTVVIWAPCRCASAISFCGSTGSTTAAFLVCAAERAAVPGAMQAVLNLQHGGGGGCSRRNWEKMRKNAKQMWKMRQKVRQKMLFSCNCVCLPQTPMFVKTHVELLMVALFKRLRPRLNMQSVVGNHTLLLCVVQEEGHYSLCFQAALNPSLLPLLHSLNCHCMLFAIQMTLDGALGGSWCNTLHQHHLSPYHVLCAEVGCWFHHQNGAHKEKWRA